MVTCKQGISRDGLLREGCLFSLAKVFRYVVFLRRKVSANRLLRQLSSVFWAIIFLGFFWSGLKLVGYCPLCSYQIIIQLNKCLNSTENKYIIWE